MTNSFRYMKPNELDQAWNLLEEAMKESKAANATSKPQNFSNGKRKLENDSDEGFGNGSEESELLEAPQKKKMKSDTMEPIEVISEVKPTEKFSWGATIRNILSAKNNELKAKKLKRKVMKQYQAFTGGEWSDKVENKFNKKVNKLKGVVVDNEKIRLIE